VFESLSRFPLPQRVRAESVQFFYRGSFGEEKAMSAILGLDKNQKFIKLSP
jgi:hypothetical protein